MPRSQEPPRPNLSKTFWTPLFPGHKKGVVRRAHPIARWGDYNPTTDLYMWQNRRCEDRVTASHRSKIERALTGMWYGVENNPRCNHCEKKDRTCTRVTNDVYGGAACARCRIDPERNCSFAHGGRRTLDHKTRRPTVQDDSDDDLPVKTILSRRRTTDRHDMNIVEARSESPDHDGVQEGDLQRTIIEIPESPSFSSLFCTPSGTPPASRPTTPLDNHACLSSDGPKSRPGDMARGRYGSRGGYFGAQDSTEGPPLNVTQGPKAMRESIRNIGNYPVGGRSQFEDRLRALEADNYRYQAEKRQDRDRVLELEEQISLLKEQQDRKLKQEIRELRAAMNHAINQTIKR